MKRLEYFIDIKVLCFFILIISFNRLLAQSIQETPTASQYVKKAESLLVKKELDSSVTYLKKALDLELKSFGRDHEKVIVYYDRIGLIYKNLGEHEIALDYFKTFLRLTIKKHGRRHSYAGYGYLNIGVTYKNLLNYEMALDNYEQSLIIFKYFKKKDMMAFIYYNIGDVFTKNGENNKAIEYYNKSIDLGTKLFGENYIENGKSYKNIGALYNNQENYEEALLYYNKSLRVYVRNNGESNLNVANIYLDIADLHYKKNEYDISLTYYEKSLSIHTSILEKNDPRTVNLNLRIASIYNQKKEYDSALQYYKKGLNIFQGTNGKYHLLTSDFYYSIAKVYDKKKEFKKAISYYNNAIIANKKSPYFNDNQNTFDPSNYYDLKLLLKVLRGKAKSLQTKYTEYKNVENLYNSLKIYEQADILIDYIRKSYQNYQDKILFAVTARDVYSEAIKTQFIFYKEVETKAALEKIIYYVEKSKSNTLKDLINESKTTEFVGLSNELLEIEKTQRINRTFYQSRIIEERSNIEINHSKIKEYEDKLLRLSGIEDSLSNVLKKDYAKYYKLKYQNSIILIEEIQKKLKDESTLLEFFVSDNIIYAFIITKNKIVVKELNIPKLEEKISKFRLAITDKHTLIYKAIAHQLYCDLIAPLKNQLIGPELIIVPDSALWHLNFDLLLSQNDASNNPKKLSYLLKQYTISYANSANLLFSTEEKSIFNFSPMQKECLAFSFSSRTNVKKSNTISLSTLTEHENDLPGTRKEIKAIANIVNGNYFYGSEAVEVNFKKNASQYNILHLALHGEVDNEKPGNSKLFFTQNKDTVEDNLLYSHELFALDIPAELTVLSACNTGTGKIAKGEGIMSLGTAFQYAGTKSLLLSSWEVSDQTTPELMKYFYTNLKIGMSKSKALQQAKLQYLNTANINRTHPFYWGGFYLLGDAAPIQFTIDHTFYWIIVIVIVTIILLGLFWFRKRKLLFK